MDPDVDLHLPEQRAELSVHLIGAIALGGAIGALARWGLTFVWEAPWGILAINALGCFLIGVLMTWVDHRRPHHLARPFLGTGVLGGFTTFSTFAVDGRNLLTGDDPFIGFVYLAGTLLAALAATWAGIRLAKAVLA